MILGYKLKKFANRVAGLWTRCVHLLNLCPKAFNYNFNVIEYFANGMSGLWACRVHLCPKSVY